MTYHFVNTKDGSDRDTAINVGGSIEGIKDDAVLALVLGLDHNGLLVFLGDHDSDLVGGSERVHKDLVGNNIQLLLLLALDVGRVGKTSPVRERKQEKKRMLRLESDG